MMVARTRTVVSTGPSAVRRCPGSAVSRITPGHWGGPGARAARRTGGEVRHLVDTGAIVSTYVGPEDRDEPYLDPGRRSVHRRQDPGRGGRSLKDPVEARLRRVVRDGSPVCLLGAGPTTPAEPRWEPSAELGPALHRVGAMPDHARKLRPTWRGSRRRASPTRRPCAA